MGAGEMLAREARWAAAIDIDEKKCIKKYQAAVEAGLAGAGALVHLHYYGHLLNMREDYDGAEAMFKRAIEADPNHAGTLTYYGTLLYEVRKDYDGAEAMFKRAIEADPNHPAALSNYGLLLHFRLKDYDGAEAMLKRAIEADPNYAPVLSSYGLLLHTKAIKAAGGVPITQDPNEAGFCEASRGNCICFPGSSAGGAAAAGAGGAAPLPPPAPGPKTLTSSIKIILESLLAAGTLVAVCAAVVVVVTIYAYPHFTELTICPTSTNLTNTFTRREHVVAAAEGLQCFFLVAASVLEKIIEMLRKVGGSTAKKLL
eukprot:g1546.t1